MPAKHAAFFHQGLAYEGRFEDEGQGDGQEASQEVGPNCSKDGRGETPQIISAVPAIACVQPRRFRGKIR